MLVTDVTNTATITGQQSAIEIASNGISDRSIESAAIAAIGRQHKINETKKNSDRLQLFGDATWIEVKKLIPSNTKIGSLVDTPKTPRPVAVATLAKKATSRRLDSNAFSPKRGHWSAKQPVPNFAMKDEGFLCR